MDGRQMQKMFHGYGLRQRQIAGCIGLSTPVLSNIFTEKVKPREDTRRRLERLLTLCMKVEAVVKRHIILKGA